MPLSLERESKLSPLMEKASDLIVNLIVEEDSNLNEEFNKIIKKIFLISPIAYKVYFELYSRIPDIKLKLLDYVKDNL